MNNGVEHFQNGQKLSLATDYFKGILGQPAPSMNTVDVHSLYTSLDLSALTVRFSWAEIVQAISCSPNNRSPGPDGFTGVFFKECWEIIKEDIMAAISHFSNLHTSNLHWLNSANIALIPKKEGAESILDFCPISLIHAIAKIITKVLATRLAPHMNNLVSPAQSAFIKKRSIHDNFMYVRNLARKLHRNRTPTLLFKLDIKKAFD